jgi:NAD-dependent SIR2 family protein deacetylase
MEAVEARVAAISLASSDLADEALFKRVAAVIASATFLVIAAGAGFSADSGLAVYKDIASVKAWRERRLTYPQLCDPCWLPQDPEIFYGFHGTCLNNYRETKPHAGYAVLLRWMNTFFSDTSLFHGDKVLSQQCCAFVYTSNVDSHFEKAGFPRCRIHAIHGEQEWWQCAEGECKSPIMRPPPGFRFVVNQDTMLAMKGPALGGSSTIKATEGTAASPGAAANAKESGTTSSPSPFSSNHPRCTECGSFMRPNILMFGDSDWRRERTEQEVWWEWKQRIIALCRSNPTHRLVILELGCGKNVPSIKCGAQSLARDLPGQASVVRINNWAPDLTGFDSADMLLVEKRAIEALPRIDEHLVKLKATNASSALTKGMESSGGTTCEAFASSK